MLRCGGALAEAVAALARLDDCDVADVALEQAPCCVTDDDADSQRAFLSLTDAPAQGLGLLSAHASLARQGGCVRRVCERLDAVRDSCVALAALSPRLVYL